MYSNLEIRSDNSLTSAKHRVSYFIGIMVTSCFLTFILQKVCTNLLLKQLHHYLPSTTILVLIMSFYLHFPRIAWKTFRDCFVPLSGIFGIITLNAGSLIVSDNVDIWPHLDSLFHLGLRYNLGKLEFHSRMLISERYVVENISRVRWNHFEIQINWIP